jgi:Flp pilus assembly protein TadD
VERGRAEAIAERKRALELEPLSLIMNFELGVGLFNARDYDRAIEQFQKTLELDQNFPPARALLPAAYEQKGNYDEAIAEFKKAIALKGGGERSLPIAGLGHVYAVSGKTSEARALIDELKQLSGQQYVPATNIALIYAGLGEKDQAFAWARKGVRTARFSNAIAQARRQVGQPTVRPTLRRPTETHRNTSVILRDGNS